MRLFQEHKPLRPYQQKAIDLLRQSIAGGATRTVLSVPTGGGKTRIAAAIVEGALAKGGQVAFTVPAISLVDQTLETFDAMGFETGVVQANHPRADWLAPVQIVSVQTMARRSPPQCKVAIIDECHMRFDAVSKWMRDATDTVFIGLSATPWAKGMAADWKDLIRPVSMEELIEQGYLSPFRVFAPDHPDLTGIKTVGGDYHEGQLSERMGTLTANVVTTWLEKGRGLPTLVFAVDRAHAQSLQAEFLAAGVNMGYCDAYTDRTEREWLFGQMKAGKMAGIVNIGTLTTGVDADVRCIVLARPTKSEMLFVQMIGRGLRTAPGKSHCLILDHADNHLRMGFVTDINYTSLRDGVKNAPQPAKEREKPLPKACPSCGAVKAAGACPACGFKPSRQSEVETEDGELVEITAKPKYTMAEKQAFYSGLWHYVENKGKSKGYAAHCFRDRFGHWPDGMKQVAKHPSDEVRNFVTAKNIRFAKRRRK